MGGTPPAGRGRPGIVQDGGGEGPVAVMGMGVRTVPARTLGGPRQCNVVSPQHSGQRQGVLFPGAIPSPPRCTIGFRHYQGAGGVWGGACSPSGRGRPGVVPDGYGKGAVAIGGCWGRPPRTRAGGGWGGGGGCSVAPRRLLHQRSGMQFALGPVHFASSGGVSTTNDGHEARLSGINSILRHRPGASPDVLGLKVTQSRWWSRWRWWRQCRL